MKREDTFHNQCIDQVMHLNPGDEEKYGRALQIYDDWSKKIKQAATIAQDEGILDLDRLFDAIDFFYHEVSIRRASEFANSPTGDFVFSVRDYVQNHSEGKKI